MNITVSKLPHPEHSGDWHDKPLKWQVAGPGSEVQKFPTRIEAYHYAKIRRQAKDFTEASRQYAATS